MGSDSFQHFHQVKQFYFYFPKLCGTGGKFYSEIEALEALATCVKVGNISPGTYCMLLE
jgi:hypothetical protein